MKRVYRDELTSPHEAQYWFRHVATNLEAVADADGLGENLAKDNCSYCILAYTWRKEGGG